MMHIARAAAMHHYQRGRLDRMLVMQIASSANEGAGGRCYVRKAECSVEAKLISQMKPQFAIVQQRNGCAL